jgi:hypothetical protein
MKPRHVLLGAGLALAAALVAFGDRTPQADVAEPVTRAAKVEPRVPAPAVAAAQGSEPVILRLVPREALVGDGADEFKGGDGGLFGRQDWTPPPPPPPPAPPPPPPSAPPLPFTYIGKKEEGGRWEVYLARGADTFIVRDKTQIDDAYRAERIAPPNLTITYLPLKQVQTLIIGDAE